MRLGVQYEYTKKDKKIVKGSGTLSFPGVVV
jgi:hypothetical protein